MDRRALRLVPAATAAWLCAAIATFHEHDASAFAVGIWTLAALALALSAVARRGRRAVALVALALAFGAAAASAVAFALPARTVSDLVDGGRTLTIEFTVTGKVERTTAGFRADAVADSIRAGPVDASPGSPPITLLLREAPDGLTVGARGSTEGTAFRADPGDRSVLVVRAGAVRVLAKPEGVLALGAVLRTQLLREARGLPPPGAALVPGLAVGDTALVDDALDQAMKASSLTHLTAVSGANCAIVVALAFGAAAVCGAGRGVRAAAGLMALIGFMVLVTPEPSVVRSGAMAALAMLGMLLGRRSLGVALLSLAVAVLLVIDPWLSSSLGFALSVGATGALLVLAGPLGRGLARWMPRPLAFAIAIPLSAQLVCGPLIVLVSPSIPVYGVVANLIAAPAAPLATVLGLAACLTAPLPTIAAGLAALTWLPAAWIAATASVFAGLPGSTLPWLEGLPGLVALAVAGVAVLVSIAPRGRFRGAGVVRGMSVVLVAVGAGVALGGVAISAVVVPLTRPADWSVAACDVGQGDAVLFRSAGRVALVDTGPDPAALAACLSQLGVDRLALVVLTHFDHDHVGAVSALSGRVDRLVHGPPADAGDERILAEVAASSSTRASAGMTGVLGEARWRVLWPTSDRAIPGNDASVVIEIGGGDVPRTLLLGDLGADAQRAVAASASFRPPYPVVKVSHHGSADQDPALYRAARGAVALISVGADNDYGHPRTSVLDFLSAQGFVVARTDRDGLVLVRGGEELTVWRERSPP